MVQDMREVLRQMEQLQQQQQAAAAARPAPHSSTPGAVEQPDQLLSLPAYFQVVEVLHMPLILAPKISEGHCAHFHTSAP